MSTSRIVTALLLGSICGTVAAQSSQTHLASASRQSVPLNAKLCVAATDAQIKTLPETWTKLTGGILSCPLIAGHGKLVLNVLSVDGEKFSASIKPGQIVPDLPPAWITLPDGTHIGTLPYAFPFDPPVNLDVTFTNWKNNWPNELKLYVEDPTVTGNHSLPAMKWDSGKKSFITTGDTHGEHSR